MFLTFSANLAAPVLVHTTLLYYSFSRNVNVCMISVIDSFLIFHLFHPFFSIFSVTFYKELPQHYFRSLEKVIRLKGLKIGYRCIIEVLFNLFKGTQVKCYILFGCLLFG